jgi:hypothetical protein
MARDRLTVDRPAAAAAAAIDDYLVALDLRLRGPAAMRRAIRDELRDGLLEAERAYRAAGLGGERAAAAAVADFGEPGTVAAAFAPELAARDARGVALALLRTGPLIGLIWGLAALASGMAVGHVPPWRWPVPGIHLAFPLIAAAIATSGMAGAVTIAATGRLSARWHLTGRPARLASTAATTIAASALTCDLALLALLIASAATAVGSLAWLPATVAATASLTRLALAARAARRLLATRVRLG